MKNKLNELRCSGCDKVLAFAVGKAYNTSNQYSQNEPSSAFLDISFKGRAKVIKQNLEVENYRNEIQLSSNLTICCKECGRTSKGYIYVSEDISADKFNVY